MPAASSNCYNFSLWLPLRCRILPLQASEKFGLHTLSTHDRTFSKPFDRFFQFCDCSFSPNGSPGRELLYRNQYEHAPAQIFISHAYISPPGRSFNGVCSQNEKPFAAQTKAFFSLSAVPPGPNHALSKILPNVSSDSPSLHPSTFAAKEAAARVRLGGCSPHSAARVRVRELVHVCVVWQLRLLQLVLP